MAAATFALSFGVTELSDKEYGAHLHPEWSYGPGKAEDLQFINQQWTDGVISRPWRVHDMSVVGSCQLAPSKRLDEK